MEKPTCPTRPERLLIEFIPIEDESHELESVASKLLNKIVSSGWPRVHVARVVSVSSSTKKITWCEETQTANETSAPELHAEFERNVSNIQERSVQLQLLESHRIGKQFFYFTELMRKEFGLVKSM